MSRFFVDVTPPVLLFLSLGVLGEFFLKQQHAQHDQERAQQLLHVAGQLRATLESELNSTLHLAAGLESYIRFVKGNANLQEMEALLNSLSGQSRYIRNLAVAPGNRIKFVMPAAGNEAAIGLYFPDIPSQWPAVKEAITERKAVLAGPVKLKQGGMGLIYRVPIFFDDKYWGVVSTVVDSTGLFASIEPIIEHSDVTIALRGEDGHGMNGAVFMGSPALFSDNNSIMLDVNVPGGRWQLAVNPHARMEPAWVPWVRLSIWLVAAVFGLSLYFIMRGRNAQLLLAQRLRNTEERYRHALKAIEDGLWEWHAHQPEHVTLDEQCCRVLQLPLDNPNPKLDVLFQRMLPSDAEEVLRLTREAFASRAPFAVQYRMRGSDGQIIWIESRGSVAGVKNNRPVSVIGTMSDITERKLAEEGLLIAAAAFESQEAMFVTDADSIILRVNHAFEEVSGYAAEEAVGRNPRLLQSGRHDADFYEHMWHSIKEHEGWRGEVWNRRKNGEVFPAWQVITAVKDVRGHITHYVSAFSDISKRFEAEEKIRNLAFYDPLTGLPNRRLLADRLNHASASSARSEYFGAVMMLDLDHFKTLNDTQGHDVGDLLLVQVAERLSACVREGDTVARLGGDEFILILEGLSHDIHIAATQAEVVAEKIRAALNRPYCLTGNVAADYHNTPSIGVCLFLGHEKAVDMLIKQADIALYGAKDAGRNTIRFYNTEMQTTLDARAALEFDLRLSLTKNAFSLFLQPQVNSETGVTGAEALLRWMPPGKDTWYPPTFIPLAEETGLILPIGAWVLDTACAELNRWANVPHMKDLVLSINVSARQFRQPDFVGQVLQALTESKANPKRLKLELTESTVLDHVEDTRAKMNQLRAYGISFSLDDFGTGYSSLSYLKNLPLDQIKIDQSFVRDITTDADDAAIVQTIISMGTTLRLNVIAEGVETTAQRDFLREHGCGDYQGYLFGRPMPIDDFNTLMAAERISQ